MTRPEVVVLRLLTAEEGSQPPLSSNRGELSVSAGEDFMDIALMPRIPDELVARSLEGVVQGDGEVGDPQARAEVSADRRDHINVSFSGLGDEFVQLVSRQCTDVARVPDSLEKRHRLSS